MVEQARGQSGGVTRAAGAAARCAGQRGFTFVELAMGLVVLALGSIVMVNHLTTSYTTTKQQKDRIDAFNKAQAILTEIQAYVDRGAISAAIELDALDDGVTNKPTLTITTDPNGNLVLPNHPLSGNFQRDGDWVWGRRISVQPFQGLNNRDVRYVTVRIYKRGQSGVDHLKASLSSVVSSSGSAFPTTQVFDVYLLAVENIPGWWVFMEAVVPFVESAITDLENRNPGLELRTHWITKASYGRNQVYRPYINDTLDSHQPVDRAYYYPGRMPSGNASTFYYVPDMMKARMSFDGVEKGGYDANTNPYPYALADFYNHAMRYPREKAYHDARVAAVQARQAAIELASGGGVTPPAPLYDMSVEPTLRLFYEDLCTDPDRYRNALIINLHGELIPFPSLRNYSDPAKSPETLADVRVVTHPEELRTRREPAGAGIDDVKLRVYAYNTNPDTYSGPPLMPEANPIALQVMNVDLTDSASANGLMAGVELQNLQGGVSVGGTSDYSPFQDSLEKGQGPIQDQMYHEVSFVDPGLGQEKYTLIKLYNTPVVAPYVLGSDGKNRGVKNSTRGRLYGLEYIPSCTESTLDFSRTLYATGGRAKNTARWVVTVPGTVFSQQRFVNTFGQSYDPGADVVLTVRTRIWDDVLLADPMQSGQMYPAPVQPDNFSETYTWWADSAADVPMSERSQFQGDPRHNPYKDLWKDDPDFPNGYNWYHDSLDNDGKNGRTDYPGLDPSVLRNRWQSQMRQDAPRFFEILRNGLVNANAVYTTLTGFSYYYMGHGNEIGYDSSNGYPNSIPVNVGPWSNSTTSGTTFAQNITGNRCYVRNSGSSYWWGMPWLGELYPDHVYASQWVGLDGNGKVRGNLTAAGGSASEFYRERDETVYWNSVNQAFATRLYQAKQRTQSLGCTSFFNIDNNPGRFAHFPSSGNGNLVGPGLEIGGNYNYPIPASAPINRPWSVSSTGNVAEEFTFSPYSTNRFTANVIDHYYDHPTGNIGSGLVELVNPGNTDAAYIVVNGISNAVASGSSFIAKYSLLTMVHSFLEGGDPTLAHRIKMPPRVEIQSPTEITELNDPTQIPLTYDVFWVRWDGQAYTETTASSFVESEADLEYVLMYSRDNGQTWLYMADDTPAAAGERPLSSAYLTADQGIGQETYLWPTDPVNFPEGSYVVRVETYRNNQALHYSQHQVKVYITR